MVGRAIRQSSRLADLWRRMERWLWMPWVAMSAAALVRFLFPGTFLFKEDEARALDYALHVVRDHVFLTHTWPSSVGITNSPVFVYLLTPFAALSSHPAFVTFCLNALNLISLPIGYVALSGILGDRRTASGAVLFWGVSPIAIHYSQKIWDPVPLPFFASLLLLATWRSLSRERSRWAFWIPVLIALMAQIHQSAVFFSLAVMIGLLIHRPRLNIPYFVSGIVVAVATAAPYLSHFATSGAAEVSAYHARFGTKWPDIDVVTNFFLNLSGYSLYGVVGHDAVPFINWPVPGFGAFVAVALLPYFPLAILGIRELISSSSISWSRTPPFLHAGEARGSNLLLFVTLGLPILYLLFRVPGWPHYFIVQFPAVFALVSVGIEQVRRTRPGRWWVRLLPVLPVLSAVHITCFQSMTTIRRGGHSFGPLYGYSEEIAGEIVGAERDRRLTRGEAGSIDSLRVSVRAPKISSELPEQWRFVFREALGVTALPAAGQAHYVVDLQWPKGAWSRGQFRIEYLAPQNQPPGSGAGRSN